MIGGQQRRFTPRGLRYWAPSIQAVLVQLAEARDYARDVGCDRWQYAVEIEGLTAAGVSVHDLWELVSNGYIEHAREITTPSDPTRRFRAGENARFGKSSCFVVTDAGLQFTTRAPARG